MLDEWLILLIVAPNLCGLVFNILYCKWYKSQCDFELKHHVSLLNETVKRAFDAMSQQQTKSLNQNRVTEAWVQENNSNLMN